MKAKTNERKTPISGPLLADVLEQDKANLKANFPSPMVGSKPLPQPDLYQDPGNGFNANFTFPQD